VKSLSVCFLCNEYPPEPHGGVGRYVQLIGRAMAAAGCRVRVVGLHGGQSTAPEFEEDRGVQVYRLPRPPRDFLSIASRTLLYRKVAAWSRRGEIDLVEAADAQGWPALWPRLEAPLVIKVNGSISYFAQEAGRRPPRYDFWVERAAFRRAEFWYSCSRYAADRTEALFGVRPADEVIYNPGFDGQSLGRPAAFEHPERTRNRVVFTGTLTGKKGVRELIAAWPAVRRRRPDAALDLYGKGEAMRRSLIEALPEEDRASVRFHGHVSQETLRSALAAARVAVFPSFAEAFALAPMEAMAQSCPTIYSLQTSGEELMTHERDGLLVDPRRPEEISAAILRLLDDDALATRLGGAGQRRVLENFTTEQILPRQIRFYEKCLAHSMRLPEPVLA